MAGLCTAGQAGNDQEGRFQPACQVGHLKSGDGGNAIAERHQRERAAAGQIVEVMAGATGERSA